MLAIPLSSIGSARTRIGAAAPWDGVFDRPLDALPVRGSRGEQAVTISARGDRGAARRRPQPADLIAAASGSAGARFWSPVPALDSFRNILAARSCASSPPAGVAGTERSPGLYAIEQELPRIAATEPGLPTAHPFADSSAGDVPGSIALHNSCLEQHVDCRCSTQRPTNLLWWRATLCGAVQTHSLGTRLGPGGRHGLAISERFNPDFHDTACAPPM